MFPANIQVQQAADITFCRQPGYFLFGIKNGFVAQVKSAVVHGYQPFGPKPGKHFQRISRAGVRGVHKPFGHVCACAQDGVIDICI